MDEIAKEVILNSDKSDLIIDYSDKESCFESIVQRFRYAKERDFRTFI
jgi:hypothetical protein